MHLAENLVLAHHKAVEAAGDAKAVRDRVSSLQLIQRLNKLRLGQLVPLRYEAAQHFLNVLRRVIGAGKTQWRVAGTAFRNHFQEAVEQMALAAGGTMAAQAAPGSQAASSISVSQRVTYPNGISLYVR